MDIIILKKGLREYSVLNQEGEDKMPTPKQIYEMREVQDILGLSDNEFYCRDFSQEPINERNYKPKKTLEKFTGKFMYYHIINTKTGKHKEFWPKSRGRK